MVGSRTTSGVFFAAALASTAAAQVLQLAPERVVINVQVQDAPNDPAATGVDLPPLQHPTRPAPEAIDALLAQLDNPDCAVREKASDELSQNPTITLKDLELWLQSRPLTTEQRTRIAAVARDRFAISPRGAMGVRFYASLPTRVVVEKTFPAFPAALLLQPGDVITDVDGVHLEGPSAWPLIQSRIVGHDPGDVLPVVIRRGAERLELDLPLGSFSDLTESYLSMTRLNRAWAVRCAKHAAAPKPITLKLDAPVWPLEREQAAEVRRGQRRGGVPVREGAQFGGGGMSRQADWAGDTTATEPQQIVVFRNNQQPFRADQRRGFAMPIINMPEESRVSPMTLEQELAELTRQEAALRNRLDAAKPLPAGVREVAPGRAGAGAGVIRNPPGVPVDNAGERDTPAVVERSLQMVQRIRAAIQAEATAKSKPTAQVEPAPEAN